MPSDTKTLLNVSSILSAKLLKKHFSSKPNFLRMVCAQSYDDPGLIEMKVQGQNPGFAKILLLAKSAFAPSVCRILIPPLAKAL
jgi:hypothetical protein